MNTNLYTIITSTLSLLFAIIGMFFSVKSSKNPTNTIDLNITVIPTYSATSYNDNRILGFIQNIYAEFFDQISKQGMFGILFLAVLGRLIHDNYRPLTYCVLSVIFLCCFTVGIIILAIYRNKSKASVRDYTLYVCTFFTSYLSVFGILDPFKLFYDTNSLEGMLYDAVYYSSFAIGLSLAVITPIANTISFVLAVTNRHRYAMRWLFVSIMGAILIYGGLIKVVLLLSPQ